MLMLIALIAGLVLLLGTGECIPARRIGFCIIVGVVGYFIFHLVLGGATAAAAVDTGPLMDSVGKTMHNGVKTMDSAIVCVGGAISYVVKCIVCLFLGFLFMLFYGYLCLFFGGK